MRALLAFGRLTRPLFLFGGVAGVALGAAVAASSGLRLDAATWLWAQALVTAFQLMVHYANEWFDREADRGVSAMTRTAWSGGSGALQDGVLPERVALIAALACAGLGALATLHFALAGNGTVAALGVVILALAWSYSAPPLRLAARGLGEIDAAAVVGLLVPLLGYAAFAHAIDGRALSAAAATFTAMLAMMLGVELPDAGSDLLAGKRTLVVRWGPARSWGITAGLAVSALVIAFAAALRLSPRIGALALLPALAFGLRLAWLAARDPRPASFAFAGVALYATLASGLAIAYALAATAW